ncbi:MAG: hypothetical protein M3014_07285 [Chloroflexota bacterium]|nr:hypothetical protein [Chloroflexota bacterium]
MRNLEPTSGLESPPSGSLYVLKRLLFSKPALILLVPVVALLVLRFGVPLAGGLTTPLALLSRFVWLLLPVAGLFYLFRRRAASRAAVAGTRRANSSVTIASLVIVVYWLVELAGQLKQDLAAGRALSGTGIFHAVCMLAVAVFGVVAIRQLRAVRRG